MSKIGIIGYGFVGSAIASSYKGSRILISDPARIDSVPIPVLKEHCDVIYVCVPTPSNENGESDTSILEQVLKELDGTRAIVIAKSTASPLVYARLEETLCMHLAHVPEFLTQQNAISDYINPQKIVIGCKPALQSRVRDAILNSEVRFYGQVEYCTIGEAAMFKYVANSMLAMKVIINNEYYDLCQSLGLNWDNIAAIAKTDSRLGKSHWDVPGSDGKQGFGGACLPKDTAALQFIANKQDVNLSMLSAALNKNRYYRS